MCEELITAVLFTQCFFFSGVLFDPNTKDSKVSRVTILQYVWLSVLIITPLWPSARLCVCPHPQNKASRP